MFEKDSIIEDLKLKNQHLETLCAQKQDEIDEIDSWCRESHG